MSGSFLQASNYRHIIYVHRYVDVINKQGSLYTLDQLHQDYDGTLLKKREKRGRNWLFQKEKHLFQDNGNLLHVNSVFLKKFM